MPEQTIRSAPPPLPPWKRPGFRLPAIGLFAVAVAFGIALGLSIFRPAPEPRAVTPTNGSNFVALAAPRPMPALRFADGDGRAMTLADFRGRVVLLNVWATWCVPCRQEMPTLDRLEQEHGGADFAVVALSIDRGPVATIRSFFDQIGVKHLRIYVDPSGDAMQTLALSGIPSTFLVDREGNELGRLLGAADWTSPEALRLIEATRAGQSAMQPPATDIGSEPSVQNL